MRPDGQPIEGQVHHYDKVFDGKASTNDVYQYVGTNIVKGVVNGVNGTIFACKCLSINLYIFVC